MADDTQMAELNAAVEQWRTKHGLATDDAVFLLVDLFQIHQKHWDELKRHKPPGLEELQKSLGEVNAQVTTFRKETEDLLAALAKVRIRRSAAQLGRGMASAALLLVAIGGYCLGRGWP
jgi:hypothetical protein